MPKGGRGGAQQVRGQCTAILRHCISPWPALRASPPLLPGAAAASGLPPSPPLPVCPPPQGPSPAVVQALKQYEKHHSDAALQGVLRLVEEGTHGSAACMAAVKARFSFCPRVHLVQDWEARSSTCVHCSSVPIDSVAQAFPRHPAPVPCRRCCCMPHRLRSGSAARMARQLWRNCCSRR